MDSKPSLQQNYDPTLTKTPSQEDETPRSNTLEFVSQFEKEQYYKMEEDIKRFDEFCKTSEEVARWNRMGENYRARRAQRNK